MGEAVNKEAKLIMKATLLALTVLTGVHGLPRSVATMGKEEPYQGSYGHDEYRDRRDLQDRATRTATNGSEDLQVQTIDPTAPTRNITFKEMGRYSPGVAYGHITSELNLTRVVEVYNKLVGYLDSAHGKLLAKRVGNALTTNLLNSTFFSMHGELRDTAVELDFARKAAGCTLTLQHSIHTRVTGMPRPGADFSKLNYWTKTAPPSEDGPPVMGRKKRQLGAVIGAIAAGTSVYNLYETNQLKKQLSVEDRRVRLVAAGVLSATFAINTIDSHTRELKDATEKLASQVAEDGLKVVLLEVAAYISTVAISLTNWARTVNEILILKKLAPRFFDVKHLQDSLRYIEEEAGKRGFTAVSIAVNDLAADPVSFVAEEGVVYLMLHVPLARNDPLLLYKLVDTPFLLADGRTVRIDSKYDYLAVNSAQTEYSELLVEELSSCPKRDDFYLCPFGVTKKNLLSSCLGAVFAGNTRHIKTACRFSQEDYSQESVTQVATNKVLIFSPPGTFTTVTTTCKTIVSRRHVKGHSVVTVPNSCTLSTINFVFRPDDPFQLASKFLSRPVTGFLMGNSNFRQPDLLSDSVTMSDWGAPIQLTTNNPNDFDFDTPLGADSLSLVGLGIACLILLLVLAAVGALLCQLKRTSNRRTTASGGSPTRSSTRRRQLPSRPASSNYCGHVGRKDSSASAYAAIKDLRYAIRPFANEEKETDLGSLPVPEESKEMEITVHEPVDPSLPPPSQL